MISPSPPSVACQVSSCQQDPSRCFPWNPHTALVEALIEKDVESEEVEQLMRKLVPVVEETLLVCQELEQRRPSEEEHPVVPVKGLLELASC